MKPEFTDYELIVIGGLAAIMIGMCKTRGYDHNRQKAHGL